MNSRTFSQPASRRLEERKTVHFPALILSKIGKCLAVVRDISSHGGCLLVNRSFPVGIEIRVTLSGGIERSCIIRRCLPIAGSQKFELGLELMEDRWPENLLPSDD